MPVLSNQQLAIVIARHLDGGTIEPYTGLPARVVAYAVARSESGGNTTIGGDGGYSIGLWQVYTIAHPEYGRDWLTDPDNNAEAMRAISSNGSNFQPWTMFWSHYVDSAGVTRLVTPGAGPFRDFIPEAQAAFAALQSSPPPPPPAQQTGPSWDTLEPVPAGSGSALALALVAVAISGMLYAAHKEEVKS